MPRIRQLDEESKKTTRSLLSGFAVAKMIILSSSLKLKHLYCNRIQNLLPHFQRLLFFLKKYTIAVPLNSPTTSKKKSIGLSVRDGTQY